MKNNRVGVEPEARSEEFNGDANPVKDVGTRPGTSVFSDPKESTPLAALSSSSKKRTFAEDSTLYRPKAFEAWAMGIATVAGGIFYGWNAGLVIGFGGYFIAQVLTGLAYIVLILGLAEVVSSTSFSGGSYGMARVMLGFYVGFIVAVFEFSEYISYTAASYQYVSSFLCDKLSWDTTYEPIIALVCYLISALFVLERSHWYWGFVCLLGVYCVVSLLFYCLGSLPYTDFAQNASLQVDPDHPSALSNWFAGGMSGFMAILPLTTWGFGGIESGALVTDLIYEPRKNVTRGLVSGVFTLFVLMIFVMFVCVSMSPGLVTASQDDDGSIVVNEMFQQSGFEAMGFTSDVSDWMMFPAQIAMAFGFILPASNLLHAMAGSKLIPEACRATDVRVALFYTLLLSYCLCLTAIYVPQFDITNIPIMFAMLTYLSDIYAYVQMQTNFATMEREFRSPLGLVGAGFAAMVFSLCLLSLWAFQPDYFLSVFLVGYVSIISLYYFGYAKNTQVFSNEEQKTLLTMHVIRLNQQKRKLKKMKLRSGLSSGASVVSRDSVVSRTKHGKVSAQVDNVSEGK